MTSSLRADFSSSAMRWRKVSLMLKSSVLISFMSLLIALISLRTFLYSATILLLMSSTLSLRRLYLPSRDLIRELRSRRNSWNPCCWVSVSMVVSENYITLGLGE